MLDKKIFENIRQELKQTYIQIQNDKIDSQKTLDYLFYHNKKSYNINLIIEILKSDNISLNTDNFAKINYVLQMLNDISEELNDKEENTRINTIQKEENERFDLIIKVKQRLQQNKVLFDCDNLQCIYINYMLLTEPAEFLNFLSEKEMIYTIRGAHVKIYKNTTENIKEKIADFLKKDFKIKSQENLIPLLDSNYFFKAKIQWEDILNYCEIMHTAVFIN